MSRTIPPFLQYGSCRAPAQVQDLQGLQAYLLQTSRAVRKRSPEAADALQQLATEVVRSSEQLQQLQQDLKDARGFLDTSKEKTLHMMIEITSLKESSNKQNEKIQQLENNLRGAQEAARNSQQQVDERQQQVQEKEQQIKKLQDQLQQQPQQAAASAAASTTAAAAPPAAAEFVAGRLHALELAGLQCNAVQDQEVGGCGVVGAISAACCVSFSISTITTTNTIMTSTTMTADITNTYATVQLVQLRQPCVTELLPNS